jgi:hypothetical protein
MPGVELARLGIGGRWLSVIACSVLGDPLFVPMDPSIEYDTA